MHLVVSRYLALLLALGLVIGETIISWGHWQFAPLWIIDYLTAIFLFYAFYRTRAGASVSILLAAWAFSAGVFYMDLFVNIDPHLPPALYPGTIVIWLIVLVLAVSVAGFVTALLAGRR